MWTDDVFGSLRDFVARTSDDLYLLSPYLKLPALRDVLAAGRPRTVTVVTRWRTADVLAGASDVDVYPFLRRRSAALLIHPRLHAKVALNSAGEILVATANVTARGLGLVPRPNVECAAVLDCRDRRPRDWVDEVVRESHVVSDAMYEAFRHHLDAADGDRRATPGEFDFAAWARRTARDDADALPVTESPGRLCQALAALASGQVIAPAVREAARADADLLQLSRCDWPTAERCLGERFFSLPSVRRVERLLDRPRYFGELKRFLRRRSLTRPTDASELTRRVQTLLCWLTELGPGEYVVDRPHHSQRIRRRRPPGVRRGA